MATISSYDRLESLGRERLSRNFFMRDFLHSEIAAWYGLRNVPDDPDATIKVGQRLCEELLEPLQATFGRIHIRSGYRSPEVNRLGNENRHNCASNEANFARHIWDYPDATGRHGATACIVIPWLVDHIAKGGAWTDMAWWIHDHLPYGSLYFFPKLAAFNINWHEVPERRIDSYAPPKGCLTRPGMANHTASHPEAYRGFPSSGTLRIRPVVARAGAAGTVTQTAPPVLLAPEDTARPTRAHAEEARSATVAAQKPVRKTAQSTGAATISNKGVTSMIESETGGPIRYRAIHTRTLWRKASNHKSLEAAINGKDGAAGLFARKVRIDYVTHGDPLFVLVWEVGASRGYAIRGDQNAPHGIEVVRVPVTTLERFERDGQGSQREISAFFAASK